MSRVLSFSHSRGRIAFAIAAVASVCAFAPSLARAADFCVNDAACVQAGGTKSNALEDALAAANAAPSPDRIFVGPGTYAAPTTSGFSNTQYPVEITGAGPDKTTLTGPTNTSPVLTVNDFSSVVSNLAIVIPPENDGLPKTGLLLHATARNLSITDLTASANATTGAKVGPGLLEDSTIMVGIPGPKAAIGAATDARISNVDVTGTHGIDVSGADVQIDRARVTGGAVGVWATGINTLLTNSLIHLPAGVADGIFVKAGSTDAKLTARNVTVAGAPGAPTTGIDAGSSVAHTATVIVDSTVIRGAYHSLWRSASAPGTANIGVLYSDYDAASVVDIGPGLLAPGAGNIDADPLFAAPLDFHPLGGSPVIDGGDPATFNDTADLDGNSRVVGGRRDMGAYEMQPQPQPPEPPAGQPPLAPTTDTAAAPPSGPTGSASTAQSTPTAASPVTDALAPALTALKIAPARFTARRGAAFRFSLSEPAKVTIAIRRRAPQGSRFVKVGTLVRSKAAGAGSVAIKRRVGAAALRPGSYTATVTATDAAGNRSRAYVLKFRVVVG